MRKSLICRKRKVEPDFHLVGLINPAISYVLPWMKKLSKIILKYTDENYLFKDDDTHDFIKTNNSVAIKLNTNKLENKIFANQFILSIKNPVYI